MSGKETARKKREEALTGLYEGSYERLARYIFVRIGNQTEAEDLASEVFLKAFRSLDSYEERGLPMEAWLFKIAHNLVIDYVRKAGKRQTVCIDDVVIAGSANPEEAAESSIQVEKLTQALKQLPESQREVIGLRFFSDLSSEEAGEVLGKKAGAVREMQRVALQSLRKAMNKETQI
ncbi:MAG: sigma-70 family RNA polymerase sigma factor [Dehalococcoidia bacterium]|nr:sigma-70 family RNA polymerase sigma factor [Dehalococcoidia bacterium]